MKKCPFCAEMIQDEAIVCRYCNRDLLDIHKKRDMAKISKIDIPTTEVSQKGDKSPLLASLLNIIPFPLGWGYIYLGRWPRFFLVVLIQFFSLIPMTMLGLREYNSYLLIFVWVITIIDGYLQGVEYNRILSDNN